MPISINPASLWDKLCLPRLIHCSAFAHLDLLHPLNSLPASSSRVRDKLTLTLFMKPELGLLWWNIGLFLLYNLLLYLITSLWNNFIRFRSILELAYSTLLEIMSNILTSVTHLLHNKPCWGNLHTGDVSCICQRNKICWKACLLKFNMYMQQKF